MTNNKLSDIKEENNNMIIYATVGFGLLLFLLTRISSARPSVKYSCTGSPDYNCIQDINGTHNTIEECKLACTLNSQVVDVIVNE
jgi:hypothetical protein